MEMWLNLQAFQQCKEKWNQTFITKEKESRMEELVWFWHMPGLCGWAAEEADATKSVCGWKASAILCYSK